MNSLDGRTALVTGGTRGIGAATVRAFAAAGARVDATYRHDAAGAAGLADGARSPVTGGLNHPAAVSRVLAI